MKYGYIAFYNGKRHELYADSLFDAKEAAIAFFKVPKSKIGLVAVVLAEKDGVPVMHIADF